MFRTNILQRVFFLSVALIACATAAPASPLGTEITYQGRLDSDGAAAQGGHDLRFQLFTLPTGGTQVGATVCRDNVDVVDGLFTATLDFGAVFDGNERFLQISVRSDETPGNCTTASGYTPLSPRQPITPAPYALYALNSPAVDTHSLDAADGSPTDVVFVNNAGNVGVGTTTPAKKLTVAGDMELGTHAGDYRHFRIGGGNCSGFLYGSYPAWGDGIHMGYNYYADAAGTHRIVASDGQTSRVSMGYGYIALATGATNQVPVNRLTVTTAGNVGLGTDGPAAKLDVRGNVKLGPSGQYFAPSGEENLRIVRGNIDGNGTIMQGSGFTVSRIFEGQYRITLSTPFTDTPSVTVTCRDPGGEARPRFATVWEQQLGPGSFLVLVMHDFDHSIYGLTDSDFSFIAIGPR